MPLNQNQSNVLGGAASGAMAGAALGPWGALGGGLLGAFTGYQQNQSQNKQQEQLGKLQDRNAAQIAQQFMPSQTELQNQQNQFQSSLSQSVDQHAQQLIATGVVPAQAYEQAQRQANPQMTRFAAAQNQNLMHQQRQLGQSLLPHQFQREDDQFSIQNQISSQPGAFQSGLPLAASMWAGQGKQGVQDAWSGFGAKQGAGGILNFLNPNTNLGV